MFFLISQIQTCFILWLPIITLITSVLWFLRECVSQTKKLQNKHMVSIGLSKQHKNNLSQLVHNFSTSSCVAICWNPVCSPSHCMHPLFTAQFHVFMLFFRRCCSDKSIQNTDTAPTVAPGKAPLPSAVPSLTPVPRSREVSTAGRMDVKGPALIRAQVEPLHKRLTKQMFISSCELISFRSHTG